MNFLLLRSPASFLLLRFFFYFNTVKLSKHLPDRFPVDFRPFPYPNPTSFCVSSFSPSFFGLQPTRKSLRRKGKKFSLKTHRAEQIFARLSFFIRTQQFFLRRSFIAVSSISAFPWRLRLFPVFFRCSEKRIFPFSQIDVGFWSGFGLVLGRNSSRQCSNIPFLLLLW